jgi:hypothetical protein
MHKSSILFSTSITFKGYFGNDWSEDYTHDFLFELSDRETTKANRWKLVEQNKPRNS